MTKIESQTVTVNKSAEELYQQLLDFENFGPMMPDNVENFEAQKESFRFKLKGMPEVGLKLAETLHPEYIKLQSASDKFNFSLSANIKAIDENHSEVQYVFLGEFNMMMRMMVEKPLKKFIERLAEHTATL